VGAFLQFLMDVKSGKSAVRAPVYSHQSYDILPNTFIEVHKPDILIVEGLNILQTGSVKPLHAPVFISDFFDFSIFVDAEIEVIHQWYIDRVIKFSQTSFRDKESYFHHISQLSAEEVRVFAAKIWRDINAVNLMQNILPYRDRAQLILKKDKTHAVEEVRLRKL